jgi:D-alanyl-D-alanine carboxypeptidase/D-alanyl-D-alanine-endopeptidase (penicillin-binding protein 4)
MVYRQTSLLVFTIIILLMINCFSFSKFALAGENTFYLKRLNKLIINGGYLVEKDNKIITSRDPDKLFIPASTWKIATALAALKTLGTEYRFTTTIYINDHHDLYIKGNGDPFLVSEEVALLFDNLKQKNIDRINNIYLDDTNFQATDAPEGAGKSLNPYDVANGALVVNFNTVNLQIENNGIIKSAEPQTPTLPIMQKLGKSLPKGTHRINISLNKENVLRHTGELFRAIQYQKNIPGTGTIEKKKVPPGIKPFYIHQSSKKLPEIIEGLMLYSNNFIINQLFLTLGAQQYGYPATWEKGKKALEIFLYEKLGLAREKLQFVEGSGLSRNNKITPETLLTLLEYFKPYANLMPLDKGRRIKSGTLTDVFCYAGYFVTDDRYDAFVLILNQPGNHRDKIIDILEQIYREAD